MFEGPMFQAPMFQALRRYSDFTGRSARPEYWLFYLFTILVALGFGIVSTILRHVPLLNLLVGLAYVVFALGILVPSLAVSFRRLHDTDRSAWWLLIAIIPFIGAVALLVFLVLPGTPGENRFGPPPGQNPDGLRETFA